LIGLPIQVRASLKSIKGAKYNAKSANKSAAKS
jgi:hypothetical protein